MGEFPGELPHSSSRSHGCKSRNSLWSLVSLILMASAKQASFVYVTESRNLFCRVGTCLHIYRSRWNPEFAVVGKGILLLGRSMLELHIYMGHKSSHC